MAYKLNNIMRDMFCDTIKNGLAVARINVYSGVAPANADDSSSGTMLASMVVDHDNASAGSGPMAVPATGAVIATGTAGYARLRNSAQTQWIQGDCGTGTSNDFVIDVEVLADGGTVVLTEATLLMAAE